MAGIHVVFDDSEVTTALNQLLAAGTNIIPVLEEFGAFAVSELAEQFQNSTDPYGFPWIESERAKNEPGGKTLVDIGHLRDSFSVQNIGNDSVLIGSDSKYAAIHQFGGETGSKNGRFTMVERPMLPMDGWPTTWEEEMVTLLCEHLEKAL